MRKKIVAGNWKMNLNHQEGMRLLSDIVENSEEFPQTLDIILFPPSLYVSEFARLLATDPNIFIGAQNCSPEKYGAYTGEISASMIHSVGASYCLTGHSERRSLFGEDDETVRKKLEAILDASLLVVFCCGEQKEIREAGNHFSFVENQIRTALKNITAEQMSKITIAYEPVWAIGTGLTASPEQAQEMHAYIRDLIKQLYSAEIADSIRILYGGSCNAENAVSLFSCPDVDGGLIGGAALKFSSFFPIIKAAE